LPRYKSCRDIKTVDQAAACAKKLYDDGLFKHMTGQHKFIHGTYIYQFCPPYGPAVAKSSGGWFSSRRGTEKAKAVAAERPLDSPTSETAPRTSKRRRVARSNEVIIDLDPHRVSDRAETATLRHDLLYNECVLSKSERWRALTLIWAPLPASSAASPGRTASTSSLW
jgi:hypothetical protein